MQIIAQATQSTDKHMLIMAMWFYGNSLAEFSDLAAYYVQLGLIDNLQKWFQLLSEDMDQAGDLLLWITGDLAHHKLI